MQRRQPWNYHWYSRCKFTRYSDQFDRMQSWIYQNKFLSFLLWPQLWTKYRISSWIFGWLLMSWSCGHFKTIPSVLSGLCENLRSIEVRCQKFLEQKSFFFKNSIFLLLLSTKWVIGIHRSKPLMLQSFWVYLKPSRCLLWEVVVVWSSDARNSWKLLILQISQSGNLGGYH